MSLELKPEEVAFLKLLLEKELGETHTEIHHTWNSDYKSHLQARVKLVQGLIERL